MFWGGFEQQATTFNIFALDFTDRTFMGGSFREGVHPAAYYQAINPIGIILFAPFFAWIWVSLGARNMDPSAPLKMGLGYGLPQPALRPWIPDRRICFWGGWGGSIVIIDTECRLCLAYMMNRMAPGIIGGPNAAALVTGLYDIVGR